ncbi:MAG TPA: homoserine dehydrogenase [Chitinivibrionales bacterium]|nr:homoserine dehydrogenase [Chitinivibrionales bacterium]
MKDINIGLVGAGVVGGGVVKMLSQKAAYFRESLGLPLVLKRIADKAANRFAELPVGNAVCTDNADDILNDKDIQIVIELVGGTTFARSLITSAVSKGKHVISANKALIAEFGPELFQLAEKNNVSILFEAAVGGGMPVIKTIREALLANEITMVKTIINGTCNYILTQMADKGLLFDTALKKAQKSGFAEADPTLDIGGGDSGHKVAIMASLIHGGYVPLNKVYIEGITNISKEDITFAQDLGYCIKLLGIIRKTQGDDRVDVRVHPAMLHRKHILASVGDVFNAVLIEGNAVGATLLYGRGAGELPTASAVVSDIVDVARNISSGAPKRIPMSYYRLDNEIKVKPIDEVVSRYYLCFWVSDKPKVLASIAAVLGNYSISIASVLQKESTEESCVPVIFLTHKAVEKNMRDALKEIETMEFIKKPTHVIRITGQTY